MKSIHDSKQQRFEEPTLTPIDLLQEYATGDYLPNEPDPPGLPGGGNGGESEGSNPNSSTPPWP